MIRPFTFITMLLAAGSGAYLFGVKHHAQVLDDQLAATAQNARLDEQRIRVLQAQWALEIDPTRLTQLAGQFTTLQPMKPAQLVTLAALRQALPLPQRAVPVDNPVALGAGAPAAGAPAAGAPAMVAQTMPLLPLPPPPAPELMLAANVPPPPFKAPARQERSVLHLASAKFTENMPAPRPLYAEPPQHQNFGATVLDIRATIPAVSDGGSVLGMAADLAPPQPLAPGG